VYKDLEKAEQRFLLRRLAALTGIISAVFLVLALRLYYLQVVRGPLFRQLSEENRLSLVRVRAPRGNIFDRYGNVLVTNRPSFSVNILLENVSDLPGTVGMLGGVLGMEEAEVYEKIRRQRAHRYSEPVRVKEDVGRKEVALLESSKYEWPGVQIEVEPRRSYPYGKLAAHLLGHVGQISQKELEAHRDEGYRMGDYVGKKGIEKMLGSELKGVDGALRVEVDSLGREVRVLASREPRPGNNVTLTLDLSLQQVADQVLRDKAGAVVVLDPRSGEILAASSSPAIDPNRFIRGLTREEWAEVEKDEQHPLQNRILRAQYPPGSIFKVVTALAALEKGVIDEKTVFTCRGSYYFGKRSYGCWKRGGHGEVSLHRALVESCDVYFYQVGNKTGIDGIARYAEELGLGKATGISLGGESSGIVPSREWKRRARGEPWYPGETLSASIGQGYNLVTPLQMAVLAGVLANNGGLYTPRLIKSIADADGNPVGIRKAPTGRQVEVSPRSLRLVREALRGVVEERRGTGRAAAVPGLEVSGKTGTAQVVKLRKGGGSTDGEEVPLQFRDHAWFISYAPSSDGRVAIAIVVEHGGHGGSASAPLAGRILTEMKNLGFFRLLASR
jgi:penicillin-binding protein 2